MLTNRLEARTAVALFIFLATAGVGIGCHNVVALDAPGHGGGGGASTDGDGGSGQPGSNPAGCPATWPMAGTPCAPEGESCTYGDGFDSPGEEAVCYGGTWATYSCPDGVGPACVCPDPVPVAGTACNPCWSEPCFYDPTDACGGPTAQCEPDGTWSVSQPPCPPGVPPPCAAFTDPTSCAAATAGCAWLAPACDAGVSFTAGCFDQLGCTLGTICANGMSCVTTELNDCLNMSCDCVSQANLCIGPP
jgi:hypothetical protein